MLSELKNARQVPGEGFRRWFTDADMDLVVWYQDETLREIHGFQLSYDKRTNQHALTWTAEEGFTLNRVDDGESVLASKMSPVLVPGVGFDGPRVLRVFLGEAAGLEYGLVSLVRDRLGEFTRYFEHSQEHPGHQADSTGRLLLDILRDAFYGPGLHGPSLLPSLRSLTPAQVTWRPAGSGSGGELVNAWQIALHCAFWKRSVTHQLQKHLGLPASRPAHPFELADWAAFPEVVQVTEWQECLEALRLEHESLVDAVGVLVSTAKQDLRLVESGSGFSWAQYAYGMAAHDVYHTAQLRNIGIPGLADD